MKPQQWTPTVSITDCAYKSSSSMWEKWNDILQGSNYLKYLNGWSSGTKDDPMFQQGHPPDCGCGKGEL